MDMTIFGVIIAIAVALLLIYLYALWLHKSSDDDSLDKYFSDTWDRIHTDRISADKIEAGTITAQSISFNHGGMIPTYKNPPKTGSLVGKLPHPPEGTYLEIKMEKCADYDSYYPAIFLYDDNGNKLRSCWIPGLGFDICAYPDDDEVVKAATKLITDHLVVCERKRHRDQQLGIYKTGQGRR